MRIRNLVAMVGVLAFSAQAVAEEGELNKVNEPVKEAAATAGSEAGVKKSKDGYGAAGCGLGSLLFSPSNGFMQVFAATTNGSSGSQTFGISSGTSNCDGAGYQPGSTAAYIQTNRAALAKDSARGRGATITGLSELAGCSSARAVGRSLKKNFTQAFPGVAASDTEISQSVIQTLKSDRSLACKHLG